jgi:hypothetical protein
MAAELAGIPPDTLALAALAARRGA